MPRRKRDHKRYTLWDGRKVVYIGIAHEPSRAEEEHRAKGWKFSRMQSEGPAVTRDSALMWQHQRLEGYRHHHGRRNPKYNNE